jgi:fumarylacetoacetase
MDFELEMGVFLSKAVPFGQRLQMADVKDHIFGFVILNDWSARDIQQFEMPPLGPFHSKGMGTTISPWVITLDALKAAGSAREAPQEPSPLPHLAWNGDLGDETFDIELTASIKREPLCLGSIAIEFLSDK